MSGKRTLLALGLLLAGTGGALAQTAAPISPESEKSRVGISPDSALAAQPTVNPDAAALSQRSTVAPAAANPQWHPRREYMTSAQARRRLQDLGFMRIGNLHREQNASWQAKAVYDGRPVTVRLDPHGRINIRR